MFWPSPVSMARRFAVQFLAAHHVRHDHKNQLVVFDAVILGAEDVLQDRNIAEAGNARPVLRLFLVFNAAQDAGLALFEPDNLIDDALAQNGLGDAFNSWGAALEVTSICIFKVTSSSSGPWGSSLR